MRTNRSLRISTLALLAFGMAACAALQGGYTLPDTHPEELPPAVNPVCTDCHDPDDDETLVYAEFSHGSNWLDTHRQVSYSRAGVCSMCHGDAFCADCHGGRVELKPSVLRQPETYRQLPHRGDYLSRHRVDARVDPTSCFRCHGNPKASRTCAPCHG